MIRLSVRYKYYKNCEEATRFSYVMGCLRIAIVLAALLYVPYFFFFSWIAGTIALIISIFGFIWALKYEQKKTIRIIEKSISDRTEREKRYREMNLRQKELDRLEEIESEQNYEYGYDEENNDSDNTAEKMPETRKCVNSWVEEVRL